MAQFDPITGERLDTDPAQSTTGAQKPPQQDAPKPPTHSGGDKKGK